jgi:hypothetical protein
VLGDGLDRNVAHGREFFIAAIGEDLDGPCRDHGRVFGNHHSQGLLPAHGLTGNSTVSTTRPCHHRSDLITLA